MKLVTDRVERTRFLKFMVVGVIGALVDFSTMNLLTRVLAMPLVGAGTISFVCAILSNFLWNRFWVYPDSRSRHPSRQLAMFFAVNLAGVAIRLPILHFVEPPLHALIDQAPPVAGLSTDLLAKNLTLAIAVGIVMLWNFFANRYWTYNDVDKVTA